MNNGRESGTAKPSFDGRACLGYCLAKRSKRSHPIVLLPDRFQRGRAFGDFEGTDRPRRALQRMRQRRRFERKVREGFEQPSRLRQEHLEHLTLEGLFTQRHAREMIEIERAEIGGERA